MQWWQWAWIQAKAFDSRHSRTQGIFPSSPPLIVFAPYLVSRASPSVLHAAQRHERLVQHHTRLGLACDVGNEAHTTRVAFLHQMRRTPIRTVGPAVSAGGPRLSQQAPPPRRPVLVGIGDADAAAAPEMTRKAGLEPISPRHHARRSGLGSTRGQKACGPECLDLACGQDQQSQKHPIVLATRHDCPLSWLWCCVA